MITKKRYLEVRKALKEENLIFPDLLLEYYNFHTKKYSLTYREFCELFPQYVQRYPLTQNVIVKIINFYDEKLEVASLIGKDGNVLMYT